ncbi:nuclear transport factor 2A-like isoform X2 [Zingiber officinale]|uniref:nuclear transport factor 2A-like isoform X2 n=1 Tax=Zingiber officinale TaxID=94328 RepID=UPI001C4BCE18|nr:nuclear transport factor 2A-like isoform X2 [Zingiber officinale]
MDTYAIFKDYRLLFDVFGRAFAEHYYRTFESNPQALVGLYLDYSMLTFEGEKIQGAAAIVSKLTSHPFQQCAHAISTVDCQPSGFSGGVLVVVNGFLLLGGEQHPRMFSQMMMLLLKKTRFEIESHMHFQQPRCLCYITPTRFNWFRHLRGAFVCSMTCSVSTAGLQQGHLFDQLDLCLT